MSSFSHESCIFQSFTIHTLTNFKCASTFLISAYSTLTRPPIPAEPPAPPQNRLRRLQKPPEHPSKHHEPASQITDTSMKRGKPLHFTKKLFFLLILSPPSKGSLRTVRVPVTPMSALLVTQKCPNSPLGAWELKDIDVLAAGPGTRVSTQLI